MTDVLAEMEGVRVVRSHLAFRNIKASTASLPLAPVAVVLPHAQSAGATRNGSPAKPGPSFDAVPNCPTAVLDHIPHDPKAPTKLDELDLRILYALSANARISNVDLAHRVGLSPAACLRRVRVLEARRVIRYYLTLVDYRTFDMFVVFIRLRIDRRSREWQEAFEHAVQDLPSIVEAYRIDGESDYILRGIVHGLEGLEQLLSEPLLIRPGVVAVQSAIGLRQCITTTRLSGVSWALETGASAAEPGRQALPPLRPSAQR